MVTSAVVSAVDDSSGNVTAASIVAAINAAGSSVKINADHIVLSGVVTVQDLAGYGTVQINAGNISAGGTISGCALITKSGQYDSITIDNDSIYIGDLMYLRAIDYTGYSDWALQLANRAGPLVLGGYDGVRVYHNGRSGEFWTFESYGLNLWDSSGSLIGQIVVERT